LKLKYDVLLSNFAFNFNSRRYTLVNRICEAIAMGQCRVMVANRGVSGGAAHHFLLF
jgi:hypothetical protein